jgi:hypothetical protein
VGVCQSEADRRVRGLQSWAVLGFQAFKFGDDYALLTDRKELLVGDNPKGNHKGNVLILPEWFMLYTSGLPYPNSQDFSQGFRDSLRAQFKEIVKATGATTLLASHDYDITGSLQERAYEL